jgi:hypothetical protein
MVVSGFAQGVGHPCGFCSIQKPLTVERKGFKDVEPYSA